MKRSKRDSNRSVSETIRFMIGRIFVKAFKIFYPLDCWLAVSDYFKLRNAIVCEMEWTMKNLKPQIYPIFRGDRLPTNGYRSALLLSKYFIISIHRQMKYELEIVITSTCFPEVRYPYKWTIKAIMVLEGLDSVADFNCNSFRELDESLQANFDKLKQYLACDQFARTSAVIDQIMNERSQQYLNSVRSS